jgi:hypothetical protein
MIGIYQDSFIEFLKDRLGEPVKVSSSNIICRCPWCEFGKDRKHYHMYISLEAPIFHCFFGDCNISGMIPRLINKIEGKDISDQFVDEKEVKERKQKGIKLARQQDQVRKLTRPKLDEDKFKAKSLYIKQRLKFRDVNLQSIKGLVFDINELIELNEIPVSPSLFRLRDYLQENFVCFIANNQSRLYFRNIDESQEFDHWKYNLHPTKFLDYYKLGGGNPYGNIVVLSEGIFDIFTEHIFDSLDIKKSARLYACAFSTSYASLIVSLMKNERVLMPDVYILSDSDVSDGYYERLALNAGKYMNTLTIAKNKSGKDFNITPILPHYTAINIKRVN